MPLTDAQLETTTIDALTNIGITDRLIVRLIADAIRISRPELVKIHGTSRIQHLELYLINNTYLTGAK